MKSRTDDAYRANPYHRHSGSYHGSYTLSAFSRLPGQKTPQYVTYLCGVLPPAVFGMLVVYCLKDVDFTGGHHGLPELIGIAVTCILHMWKRQMLISILGGTVAYMLLVQFVWV